MSSLPRKGVMVSSLPRRGRVRVGDGAIAVGEKEGPPARPATQLNQMRIRQSESDAERLDRPAGGAPR
jgi:hypothetical protein